MRKHNNYSPKSNKENKYDQITNLGIDIEGQLNKSVLLPRIASKIVDNQLRDYMVKRKNHEDKVLQNLREEVDKMRRQVQHFQTKKMNFDYLRTEENEPYHALQLETRIRPHASYHVQKPSLNLQHLQDSEFHQSIRLQRNTDKNPTVMKRDSSWNNLMNKDNEVELQKAVLKMTVKQETQSKSKIKSNVSIFIQKQKPVLKKQRQRNNKARRRLRKCIWAVYFSIFFPSLARKIYMNRLKTFIHEYPHDVSKYYLDKQMPVSKIKQDQADLWAELQAQLDIIKEIQSAKLDNIFKDVTEIKQVKVRFKFLLNQDLKTSQRSLAQPQTIESQLFKPKTVQYLLAQFMKIVTKLMDKFINFVNTNNIFMNNWRSYSQGILNNSFINNSHPKLLTKLIQCGLVRLNLFKEILQVFDKETEIILLTFDIFCRIYCFKWFCKLKDNVQKYSQEKVLIGSFFLTLLYIVGQMMIQQKIISYLKAKVAFQEKRKKRNKKIRCRLALMVKRKIRNDLKDINRLICDPPFWNQVSTLILENKQLAEKVQIKMKNAGTQLFLKLRQKLKQDQKQNKMKTLEQKYLIKGDKERPQNLLSYENLQKVTSPVATVKRKQTRLPSNKKIKMCIKVNKQKEYK